MCHFGECLSYCFTSVTLWLCRNLLFSFVSIWDHSEFLLYRFFIFLIDTCQCQSPHCTLLCEVFSSVDCTWYSQQLASLAVQHLEDASLCCADRRDIFNISLWPGVSQDAGQDKPVHPQVFLFHLRKYWTHYVVWSNVEQFGFFEFCSCNMLTCCNHLFYDCTMSTSCLVWFKKFSGWCCSCVVWK